MTDIVLLLRLEHGNIVRLLDVIGRELERLEQGAVPDYGLLGDVIDYFASYPDRCHHPKEELIYRKLQARNAAAVSRLELTRQHRELGEATARLARVIEEIRQNPRASPKWLKNLMRDFIEQNRAHMNLEEREFFPAAVDSLSRDDWAEIDFDLYDRPDPCFDREAEDRFRALRQRVSPAVIDAPADDYPDGT